MKRIALIPIDNRPVCYTLPKMCAELNSDIKLIMPDRRLLGSLTNVAQREALFDWLEDIEVVDYLIIPADTLIYGGLVSSRRSPDTYEEIEQRVLRLRNVLLKKSHCKTFISTSIMRIADNNINEEEKEYWSTWGKKLFAYSYNLHRGELEGNPVIKAEAIRLSGEIPKEVLIDWLSTRTRNFEVNKLYLQLHDDGLINTLVYSKDDCAEFGLNVKEAKFFEYEAEKRKGVYVKTGADEIPLSLIARCVAHGKQVKIAPVYTNPESKNLISRYEDVSLDRVVKSQINTAGAIVTEEAEADLILYINNFKTEQGELAMGIEKPGYEGEFRHFDKPFFAVDVLCANGADNKFAEKLLSANPDNFYGYTGWNTSGNSLGCGICTAILKILSPEENEKAFKRLETVRFLDEWAYQANIRKIVREQNIKDTKELKELFEPFERRIKERFQSDISNIRYTFPWDRTFEIEIDPGN